MLTLRTTSGAGEFAPGQVMEGTAGWNLEEPPKDAYLRLFWYTQGRGTQDVNVVEELELAHEQAIYEQPFRFALPLQPYSFAGVLISLQWALELVLNNGRDVQRLDLVLSPWTEKPTLANLDMK